MIARMEPAARERAEREIDSRSEFIRARSVSLSKFEVHQQGGH